MSIKSEVKKDCIVYISSDRDSIARFTELFSNEFEIVSFDNIFKFIQWTNLNEPVKLVVTYSDLLGVNGITLRKNCKNIPKTTNTPFVLLVDRITESNKSGAMHEKFADIFEMPLDYDNFTVRAKYLIQNPPRYHKSILASRQDFVKYKIPLIKRLFDIVVSLTALILLFPLFLFIAVAIRLESRGPVLYASKRVGSGYNIFNFYKFRSMRLDADKQLKSLQHLNQYGEVKQEDLELKKYLNYTCLECKRDNILCKSKMFIDGEMICEKIVLEYRKSKEEATFIKFEKDPRITRVGKFIRNSSIDELPQLFNVLIGDMSIVGNRPLPVYEAEKLTTDHFTMRFLAPAGITGLWQVTHRGKGGQMSEQERMELDNLYARDFSFLNDIKLILKTIPAIFQKQDV